MLPFSRKSGHKKKGVVLLTHEQNVICRKTKLHDIAHEQTIICRQLFAAQVLSALKRKKKLHLMIIIFLLSVNHPPNATSITNYYTVYGERLELPIEVSDPEGMPIAISLLEGSPKDATVHNGVLLWNVTTNKTTHFYFKATDACQASSTFNITVTVNLCRCQNNGKCVPQTPRGHGSYLCDCAPGYTGMNCSTEINECDSYPCFRGERFFFAQLVHFFPLLQCG